MSHSKRIISITLLSLWLIAAGCGGFSPTSTTDISALPTVTPPAATDLSALPSLAPPVTTRPETVSGLPAFTNIFIIVMENKDAAEIVGNPDAPYINALVERYGSATQYYGVSHPSLPNYLALTGGDTFSVTSDCTDCFIDSRNLVDQLEAGERSWKAYMESMPAPCFVGDDTSLYVQKHNPFIYYDDVRTNPARCKQIVPFDQFATDLQSNTVPDFVWITPNLCNDMHDCQIGTGDAWLKTWVPQILAAPAWQANSVLFIAFDEGKGSNTEGCCTYAAGGQVATLVVSPLVLPGFQSAVPYSHYSLLRTIEEAWQLPLLGKANCECTAPMSDFFQNPPAP